jgi:hypothetical protein
MVPHVLVKRVVCSIGHRIEPGIESWFPSSLCSRIRRHTAESRS